MHILYWFFKIVHKAIWKAIFTVYTGEDIYASTILGQGTHLSYGACSLNLPPRKLLHTLYTVHVHVKRMIREKLNRKKEGALPTR